jgi:ribulose-phosphate 3-epimerase
MSRQRTLHEFHTAPPVVLPSLLLCDFGNLEREVRAVEAAGARALHLDVMDGNFVPNITYGAPIIEAVRRVTDLPLDLHLMIAQPDAYIEQFVEAGASSLTIHIEAVEDPRPVLNKIRDCDVVASLALNPPTPLEAIAPYLSYCDMVLCMSVTPGFGAQEFQPVALEKLRTLKAQHSDLVLEVDGGVNEKTIAACTRAGAQMLVTGAAIFRNDAPYEQSLSELTQLGAAAVSPKE